ncbi:short-chain dehydrogenase [Botrytis cinerea]
MSLDSLFTPESGNNFTKITYHDTYSPITPDTSTPTHSGKVVFVSGASKGIGLEAAISYVKSGVSGIVISGRSSLASVEREIEEVCKSANIPVPKILALKLDILDYASVTEAAKSIETTFGRLDILINNAAYFSDVENLAEGDKDEWWMGFEVNIRGLYWVTKSLLPLLLKTDGGDKTIVNVTILAYSIHPGSVPTDLAQGLPEDFKGLLIDTPQLPADTLTYLTSQRRGWLASRYLSCNWDMNEIMSREKEIVDGDKLKFQMKF